MRRDAIVLMLLLVLSWAGKSVAGSMFIGEERYLPTGWTEPEVSQSNGKLTFKPSIPSGFEKRSFGGGLQMQGTVSRREVAAPQGIPMSFRLTLVDGSTVSVKEGEAFVVNKHRYQLLGLEGEKLVIKSLDSGTLLRMVRKPPQ